MMDNMIIDLQFMKYIYIEYDYLSSTKYIEELFSFVLISFIFFLLKNESIIWFLLIEN